MIVRTIADALEAIAANAVEAALVLEKNPRKIMPIANSVGRTIVNTATNSKSSADKAVVDPMVYKVLQGFLDKPAVDTIEAVNWQKLRFQLKQVLDTNSNHAQEPKAEIRDSYIKIPGLTEKKIKDDQATATSLAALHGGADRIDSMLTTEAAGALAGSTLLLFGVSAGPTEIDGLVVETAASAVLEGGLNLATQTLKSIRGNSTPAPLSTAAASTVRMKRGEINNALENECMRFLVQQRMLSIYLEGWRKKSMVLKKKISS